MKRALAAAAVLFLAPSAEAADLSLQEVVLRAKPATVLVVSEVGAEVSLDCGEGRRRVTPNPFRETGTGWFIDSNGWVMTNAHVVQPAHTTPRWLVNELAAKAVIAGCARHDLDDAGRRRLLDRVVPTAKVELQPTMFILVSNGFRLPAKVVKYSPPVSTERGASVMSGRDLALLQVEASEMPAFQLGESKNVKIGDPVHILGFPGVVLTHELLDSTAKVEASVTNGAISGFKQDVQNQAVIQTDAPAAWGNSGGPAINSRGEVIGVLTFVSLAPGPEGAIVQGFNFIIPADAVKEFLHGTGVDLADKSPFNDKWFTGLRRLFTHDYRGAAAAFKDTNRLQPDFPDVKRALAEAEDKIKNPPPRPFPWPLATGAVTLLGLVIAAGLYGKRRVHDRFRVAPAEVVRLFEGGTPPAIVDVRAPYAYSISPFRIPGSRHLAPDDLATGVAGLGVEPSRPLVLYCTSDEERASVAAARRLRGLGYRNVRILKGGLGGWTNAGLPLESKATGA